MLFAKVAAPLAPASSPRSSPESESRMRDLISFQCDECKRRNYTATKNKKRTTEKLALRKFCPSCRSHTLHKEAKV